MSRDITLCAPEKVHTESIEMWSTACHLPVPSWKNCQYLFGLSINTSIYTHCQYIYIYVYIYICWYLYSKDLCSKKCFCYLLSFFGVYLLTKFLISDPSSDSSSFRNFSVWLFCKYTRRACNGKSRKPLKPCFPDAGEKKTTAYAYITHWYTCVCIGLDILRHIQGLPRSTSASSVRQRGANQQNKVYKHIYTCKNIPEFYMYIRIYTWMIGQ